MGSPVSVMVANLKDAEDRAFQYWYSHHLLEYGISTSLPIDKMKYFYLTLIP